MAKVKIRHEGKVHTIELNGDYTESDLKLLEKLGIIEKPKKKKKYKNVENKKEDEDTDPYLQTK